MISKELPPRSICHSDHSQWYRLNRGPQLVEIPQKVHVAAPEQAFCSEHEIKQWLQHCGFDPINLSQSQTFNFRRMTPLLYAADVGNISVCRYLLEEQGVSIHATSEIGNTAFFYACGSGHLDIAKYLVAFNGVEVRAEVSRLNNYGCSPFAFAVIHSHQHILDWLFQVGGMGQLLVEDCDGLSPLYHACKKGNTFTAKWIYQKLIEHHVQVSLNDTRDKRGCSMFIAAVLKGCLEICVWLISVGLYEIIDEKYVVFSVPTRSRHYLRQCQMLRSNRATLIQLVEEKLDVDSCFRETFLVGTVSSNTSSKTLSQLSGQEGIRMIIADYVGVYYGASARHFKHFLWSEGNNSGLLYDSYY